MAKGRLHNMFYVIVVHDVNNKLLTGSADLKKKMSLVPTTAQIHIIQMYVRKDLIPDTVCINSRCTCKFKLSRSNNSTTDDIGILDDASEGLKLSTISIGLCMVCLLWEVYKSC